MATDKQGRAPFPYVGLAIGGGVLYVLYRFWSPISKLLSVAGALVDKGAAVADAAVSAVTQGPGDLADSVTGLVAGPSSVKLAFAKERFLDAARLPTIAVSGGSVLKARHDAAPPVITRMVAFVCAAAYFRLPAPRDRYSGERVCSEAAMMLAPVRAHYLTGLRQWLDADGDRRSAAASRRAYVAMRDWLDRAEGLSETDKHICRVAGGYLLLDLLHSVDPAVAWSVDKQ